LVKKQEVGDLGLNHGNYFFCFLARLIRVIKFRRLGWAVNVARMGEGRNAFKILTGKPTGKRHLGRPRRRWEDNIRMNLEEIAINALVNVALNLQVQ
jgi:hypothetical protein